MKFNIYDFDGTIYNGDSTIDFLLFLIKKKPSLVFNFMKSPFYFLKWKLKKISTTEFKEQLFSCFAKFNDISKLVDEFWLKKENKIKKKYLEHDHKMDIISSASPAFLLKPICKKLKVKALFASDVDDKTGKFNHINNKGEEKVKTLYKKYPNCIINKMYSDSLSDKPLLDLAKESYMVYGNYVKKYYKDKSNKKTLKDYYFQYKEGINYLIVGGFTVLINILIFGIFRKLLFYNVTLSNIIAWIGAVIFAYFMNKHCVFNSIIKSKREFINFFCSRVFTLLIELSLMELMVNIFLMYDMIAKIIVQVIVILLNYIISKFLVFKIRK